MVGSHIGHDCKLGNNLVIANNAAIAGHCIFEDDVVIDYAINQLEESNHPDPKAVQINLTGFLNAKVILPIQIVLILNCYRCSGLRLRR